MTVVTDTRTQPLQQAASPSSFATSIGDWTTDVAARVLGTAA